MVDYLMRGTPRAGRNCALRALGNEGFAVDYIGREWLHPFQLLPFWHAEKEIWCIGVQPGFVNGRDVAVAMSPDDLGPDPSVIGNNYVQGSKGKKANGDLFVALTDSPQPFLTVTNVRDALEPDVGVSAGGDTFTSSPASIPPVFRYMGVRKPQEADLPGVLHVVPLNEENPGDRLLAACDVVLTVDRPATVAAQTADVLGIPLFVGFNVVTPSGNNYGARLGVVAKYDPPPAPTLLDRIVGDYQEPTYDQLKLATLYFISPPDYDDGLDASWYPVAKHDVFWNLCYQGQNTYDETRTTFLPNPLDWSPSAAFLGQVLVNALDDNYAQALNALSQASTAGHFWTAA